MRMLHYWRALVGIVGRELLRFLHQRERFVSALVRPGVAVRIRRRLPRRAGHCDQPALRNLYSVRGLHHPRPVGDDFAVQRHAKFVVYGLRPGNGQHAYADGLSAAALVLLCSKLIAGTAVGVLQSYAFLGIAWLYDIQAPLPGYLWILPALVLGGMMLGALGLLLSSFIKQLENFAGVMNFVIFPLFFMSTALYPLWKIKESSPLLATLAEYNPFSQAVELIRFALYEQFNQPALIFTAAGFCCSSLRRSWAITRRKA